MGISLENLSWKEAEKALRDTRVLVLPVGARLKEHGLHLPLNNDWVMAEYLTRRVLAELPVVALPTVQYGYYPAFLDYPGSVSLELETFRDVICSLSRSICRHGPRKIYVLNTGISTNRGLERARLALASEGITMDYTILREATAEAERQVRTEAVGTHADEIETSMMLYMAPHIVRRELAVRDVHEDRGGANKLSPDPQGQGVYSPTGAWGDPTRATAEKGRVVVEALVSHIVGQIRRLESDDFVPAAARGEYL
jgi:creatinine amidohydrolase